MSASDVSFIVITKNEGPWLAHTLEQLLRDLPARGEVIVLDDGSTDGSVDFLRGARPPRVRLLRADGLGVARARNAGALEARGENLVFLDAHMKLPRGWWEPVVELLSIPGVGAAQPCITDVHNPGPGGFGERFRGPDLTLEWLPRKSDSPYSIPVLCGCCFAVRRSLFLKVGGLDGGMIGWGSEDCEFSLRLWRLGYEAWIDPRVAVGHLFRKRAPYPMDWSVVLHNRLRMALAHFSPSRIGRVVGSLRSLPSFRRAYDRVGRSDILYARQWLGRHCLRDDDGFLQRSGKTF
jgi:GT2 family glycosyltransferase